MLQKLNERIQGVVAWVIVILIALTFALFGVDYYIQSRQHAQVQAEVNDEPISKREFDLAYQRTRQFSDAPRFNASQDQQLKKQVMNQIIMNRVSLQSARNYGFTVSPQQANAAIVSIPQFQEDGHFSSTRYQQALSSALFTPESFQNEVRQGMMLNQQRFAFMGTAFALPNEVERFIRLYLQTRDFTYTIIPAEKFMSGIEVSDSEIKEYYQKHQKQFIAEELVSVEYVQLSLNDMKQNIQITDEEIKAYYEDNKHNYLIPAKWRVAHILFALPKNANEEKTKALQEKAESAYQQLKQEPGQFDKLVKQLSDDKISAQKNGVLPWIEAGQSDLDKTLVQLTTPGQISEPVETRHGFEIFKLIAYQPAKTKPLSQVKEEIRAQLQTERAQTHYTKQVEELSELSYQAPDSLKTVAKALDIPIHKTKPFSKKGGSSALTQNPQVIQTAFSHDVLALGNNSEPVQLSDGEVIVLRVLKHIPASQQPLAEVKAEIKKILKQQKAELKAKELALKLVKEHGEQKPIMLKRYELKHNQVSKAGRDSDEADAAIIQLAYSLPHRGAREYVKLANGNYAVVELQNIQDGHPSKLDSEQMASITQQLESNYGIMEYDLYVNQLMRQANISIPGAA